MHGAIMATHWPKRCAYCGEKGEFEIYTTELGYPGRVEVEAPLMICPNCKGKVKFDQRKVETKHVIRLLILLLIPYFLTLLWEALGPTLPFSPEVSFLVEYLFMLLCASTYFLLGWHQDWKRYRVLSNYLANMGSVSISTISPELRRTIRGMADPRWPLVWAFKNKEYMNEFISINPGFFVDLKNIAIHYQTPIKYRSEELYKIVPDNTIIG